jgi:SSS family solute:Na+ symporter
MVVAILWSPMISHFQSLFQGITAVICYIAPPITAVFLWGVLWKKASAAAAKVTLMAGSALGLVVFFLDWFKATTGWAVPPMMATFYLFLICSAILAVVSAIHPHVHTEESLKLVWARPVDTLAGSWGGILDYRLVSAILFLAMVGLYVIFG